MRLGQGPEAGLGQKEAFGAVTKQSHGCGQGVAGPLTPRPPAARPVGQGWSGRRITAPGRAGIGAPQPGL